MGTIIIGKSYMIFLCLCENVDMLKCQSLQCIIHVYPLYTRTSKIRITINNFNIFNYIYIYIYIYICAIFLLNLPYHNTTTAGINYKGL